MKKRSLAILLALTMVAGSLAGCGNSASTSSSSTSSEPAAEAGEAAETVQEEQAAEIVTEPVSADLVSAHVDEINIASERDPTDMGPWAGNMGGASAIVPLVYQSLQIKELNQEAEPCLAKTVNQVDEVTYEVELFDYITDSEGNPLTSSDIVFGLEKAKELGKVSYAKVIDSIEAVDDYNFIVHFSDTARMGDFESFFTQMSFVTQAAYEASSDGMSQHPIGTAEYVLEEYVSGSNIKFVRREDYWQTDEQYIARSSEAHADVINYPIIAEAMQRAIAVEGGQLDYGGISYTDRDRLEANENIDIYEVPDNLTFMLFANMDESAVTANQDLREAIFYALDNEGIAAMYSSGYAVPVWDISNSNYPDYYEEEYIASAAENYYGCDVDKAKELLASSGYDTSRAIKLLCSSDQACTDIAEIIKTYLSQIGLEVTIDAYQGNMMSTVAEDPANWDIYLLQYASTDYAVNVWEKVLNKDKYSWGGTINFVYDDTLQEKLSEVRTVEGHTKENVIAFHDYLIDQAMCIGLVQGIQYYAYRSDKVSEVVMSEQRIIRPNACIFAE